MEDTSNDRFDADYRKISDRNNIKYNSSLTEQFSTDTNISNQQNLPSCRYAQQQKDELFIPDIKLNN